MSATPTLYLVEPGAEAGALHVEPVWTQDAGGPLVPGFDHLVPMTIRGEIVLVAVDGTGKASTFRIGAGDPWITPADSQLDLDGPCDVIESFVIGNIPHLLTYESGQGQFGFHPVADDLSSRPPYRYARRRGPEETTGFDVTQPMNVGGAVYYLCYGSESGRVNIYSLAVTASSPESSAPLFSAPVWMHQWARRWTRFAFFRLGGGNFFLKTNVGRLNVNIDKVLDYPHNGTVEVGTRLDLEDALTLDIVRPFYLRGSEPYFLTYKKDGATTLNRFHSDCEGWTTESRLSSVVGATHIVPMQLADGTCYVLFY